MSDSFQCSICGGEHEGLPTDWAYKLPDVVWDMPAEERAERARFTDDLCQMGDRYFIRCMLEVPFREAEGYFGWGVWAEVSWPVFERYLELYDQDGTSEPYAAGKLANGLRPYAGSLGTPVSIHFRDPTNRPTLLVSQESASQLMLDQRAGIDEARYHEIHHMIRA